MKTVQHWQGPGFSPQHCRDVGGRVLFSTTLSDAYIQWPKLALLPPVVTEKAETLGNLQKRGRCSSEWRACHAGMRTWVWSLLPMESPATVAHICTHSAGGEGGQRHKDPRSSLASQHSPTYEASSSSSPSPGLPGLYQTLSRNSKWVRSKKKKKMSSRFKERYCVKTKTNKKKGWDQVKESNWGRPLTCTHTEAYIHICEHILTHTGGGGT